MPKTFNVKRSRSVSISEPSAGDELNENAQPTHLTVQGLPHHRPINSYAVRKSSFANPSALAIPVVPAPVPEDPAQNAIQEEEANPPPEYMRYLSNLSTVTINNGREFRNVPAYLRQFEMSRRGTMSTLERPTLRSRRISVQSEDGRPQIIEAPEKLDEPKKTPNKFKRILFTIMSKHRTVGLRHFALALILALYHVGGMFLFFAIEGPYERKNVAETREALNEAFNVLSSDLEVAANMPNANMTQLLKKAYLTLIKIDGKYTGSTLYKLEERSYPLWTWTYGTAFFYAFTLFSTVGYGSISPSTDWGRAATIVYTAVGFPCALVIIRDIGSVVLVYLTRIYAKVVIKIRTAGGYASSTANEGIMLPMKVALLLSFIYALLTALFIMTYDSWLGPEPGLDLFHSFYFTFLSYAAVGLGDVMPVNYAHAPIVALVLLTGFPLMRVINRVLYVGIENGMYGSVMFVEDSIDNMALEKKNDDGDRLVTVAENVESGPKSNLSTLDEDEDDDSGEEEEGEDEEDEEDNRIHNELMNNFTIQSESAIKGGSKENSGTNK